MRSSASTSSRRPWRRPLKQIALNAGADGDLVVEKIKEGEGNFGYDAATGEYTDLVKAGIIDPAWWRSRRSFTPHPSRVSC
jgi:chaperonin GroEL (HSP60 family)